MSVEGETTALLGYGRGGPPRLTEIPRTPPRSVFEAPDTSLLQSKGPGPPPPPPGIGMATAVCYILGVFGVVPVVSLPGAIAYCGWFGFVVFGVLVLVQVYTAVLLGKCWLFLEMFWPREAILQRRYPYPALAEKAGGTTLRRVVSVMQDVAIFGAAVPFMLLASDTLQELVERLSGVDFSFCYWLLITTLVLTPLLWLGTPKDLGVVTWIGAGCMVIVSVLTLAGLVLNAPQQFDPPPTVPSFATVAYCFGAVAFQYVSEKMTLLSDFDHMLREKFLTSCKTVNFDEDEAVRQEINAAVEKETNSRIKDLIPQGFFSNLTRMVLVNAVYFKGSWEQQFMESETFEENFWITENESIMVPMMHIKEDFRMMHNKDLGAKLLAMDYKGSRLSIVFVLPDKRDGLPEIETNLDSLDLNNIDTLMTVEVKVTLPKFKLEESLDLVSHLREMGVRDLFDEGSCDLSRITGNRNLYVSKVVHKAFLEVNEKGSEAAAATAVSIMFCCYRGPPQEFVVDHPFCFFIRDRHSGLVLFAGRFLK